MSLINKQHAKIKAKEAGHEAKPWVRSFARFGFFAKGTVYILIGILSFMAALGVGGKTTGSKGAFASVASQPFGEIILWIVAIGLLGYVFWRVFQVINDPYYNKTNTKRIVIRTGFAISAGIYGFLIYKAVSIAMHADNGGGSSQTSTAKLLSQPFGPSIIMLVGIGIIIFAISEIIKALQSKFKKHLMVNEMNHREKQWFTVFGKTGLIARGLVFCIIGSFLIQNALTSNPDQTVGLDRALSEIAQQPFGQWMLGITAIGLFLYGVFLFFKGKYAKISLSS
ncbi:DUF1206 domain-containing protein [Aquibacillus rhizosphaerae]|uniref:DUF1206 domain-containing protein n=1 Tax=Aquibacillus rhizosphaerae TaxID=3051431 RepID=A0ABT7L1S4_9BACI|nr:DUF1206 domain-containing protein [Aquibacillus sp. LR5S19]MDL4839808.1 DUF1206 domain-containing protein [Aquibacillus sp. LR5S19]